MFIYIKDIIFQKNLHFTDLSILITHNLKILLNTVCKAAAVISLVISDLSTITISAIISVMISSVISHSSINDLFIDKKIQS
ncbi:hypothetical protein BDFG_08156, partial [Blastomyces dermatitidis ATCC 26199]